MKGINKVILVGTAGSDPISYSSDKGSIANLSMATNESWKNKTTGETNERVEWHRCVFFGRLAETVMEIVRKGATLYVEGKLSTSQYTDKEGVVRQTTQVVVSTYQILSSKKQTPATGTYEPNSSSSQAGDTSTFDDDDIPF